MKTLKWIFLLSIFSFLVIHPISAQEKNKNDEVHFNVDQMPEYPGGQEALKQFIAEKVVYPEDAKKEGIQGKVYVSFTVDKKGEITDTKIARGVDTSLDKEALRVTKSMPAWQPGKQDGNLVNVRFTMPIHFALALNDEE